MRRSPTDEHPVKTAAIGLTALAFVFVIWGLQRVVSVTFRYVRDRRSSHVLLPEDPSTLPPWERASRLRQRRPTGVGLPVASSSQRTAETMFGFEACAHTVFAPLAGSSTETETWAYELARSGAKEPVADDDREIWHEHDLDNPDVRQKYRNQVELGRLLTCATSCLYCNSLLVRQRTAEVRAPFSVFTWNYRTAVCPCCGWWCVTHRDEEDGPFFWCERFLHAYAVMRCFDPMALDAPLELARDFLARHPHKMARFDPFRFEQLMASCLRDSLGDAEIVPLGGRKDGGIDIKAIRTDGETTLIQVKRRSDFARREGVAVVRELHGVMLREGVPRGMVISTARDYSREARAEAAAAGRRLAHYSMDLLSYDSVVDLLGRPSETRADPWVSQGVTVGDRNPGRPAAGNDWIDRSVLPPGLYDLYDFGSAF